MQVRNRVAGAAFLVALPVAVWGILGDLSTTQHDPDHLIEPLLDVPRWAEYAIGAVAVGVVLVAIHALRFARPRASREGKAAFALAAAAGLLVGAGWRVVTAGVIGANIGGGFVIVFGGPTVVGLLAAAVVLGIRAGAGHDDVAPEPV